MEVPEHKPGSVDDEEQMQATVTSVASEASLQIVWQRLGFEAGCAAA